MSRQLYLTFDDGPHPVWTPRVLDALAEIGAVATFFVDAQHACSNGDVVERALREGHAVEFHCVDHVSHEELTAEEGECEARTGVTMLRERFGPDVAHLWRPPYGSVAPWQDDVATAAGLELRYWTADTGDWRGFRAAQMLALLLPRLSDGAIVLLHDGIGPGAGRDDAEETVKLLPLLAKVADGFLRW